MVAKDYEFNYVIKDSYKPEYKSVINTTDTATYTGDWWYHNYPMTNTVSWSYTNTVYMYQIFCPKPRCKGVFWGQIDQVATCPKCSSRVKVTDSPPPDYEVEVIK